MQFNSKKPHANALSHYWASTFVMGKLSLLGSGLLETVVEVSK